MPEASASLHKQIIRLPLITLFGILALMVANAWAEDVSAQNLAGNQVGTPLNQETSLPIDSAAPINPVSTNNPQAAAPVTNGTTPSSVEINGDKVEFLTDQNKVLADGNVVISQNNVKLLADHVEFDRSTNIAIAEGHVILMRDNAQIIGDKVEYNYATGKGEFDKAKIDSHPYYGSGDKIAKVGDKHIIMENGHFTTCDHDKPHFQMVSKKIDVYPGDKLVARSVRMLIGNVPIMFLPRYSQNINDKKPRVIFTPGYDKDWGAFLLSQWRYYLSDDFKGTVHLDYRERKDLAWGIDTNYKTKKYGSGIIRTYYTKERDVGSNHHFWEKRLTPTPEHERFKAEWRHQWEVDDKTNAIWQYSKLSDANFLEDYFKHQKQEDSASPQTYFLLTRTLPLGILSLRNDKRVNRFDTMVERLPEIRYDLPSHQLGESNFYLLNQTIYSNLSKKLARPSDDRRETMRLYTDNEINYPMKISFIELTPFVGNSETYYSKTMDPAQYNVIRGQFRTGANLSTKFYRIFDVETNKWGLNIHKLRHVITPSIGYAYFHDPTIPSSLLDQFDEGIDDKSRSHGLVFGIENKLQTKRKGKNVDLVRALVSTDFKLKEDTGKGGFNSITADIETRPYQWLGVDLDAKYDTINREFESINTDLNLWGPGDPFYLSLSKRWNGPESDELVSEFGYKINQKWSLVVQNQFDLNDGSLTLQEYSIKRDLHDWIMEINFNQTRGNGSEIWMVFTLKAFPELGFDFGTGFNKRKAGAQQ